VIEAIYINYGQNNISPPFTLNTYKASKHKSQYITP